MINKDFILGYGAGKASVPPAPTPTGTKNITQNGDYDVTSYALAHVAVPTSGSASVSGTVHVHTAGYSTHIYGGVEVVNGEVTSKKITTNSQSAVDVPIPLTPNNEWVCLMLASADAEYKISSVTISSGSGSVFKHNNSSTFVVSVRNEDSISVSFIYS